MMLTILLLVAICSDDKIYVVTNNNRDSKCIISDINRTWIDRSCFETNEVIYELVDAQCRLSQSLILIDSNNYKDCSKHRTPRLESYPRYRIGEYRTFREFDYRTFSSAGYPTLSIFAMINNHNADENKWKRACDEISRDDARKYLGQILIWGDVNRIKDVENIGSHFESEEDALIYSISDKYSGHKSFPKYKKSQLPDSPIVRFPYHENN